MSVVSFDRFTSFLPDPLTKILSVMASDLHVVAA